MNVVRSRPAEAPAPADRPDVHDRVDVDGADDHDPVDPPDPLRELLAAVIDRLDAIAGELRHARRERTALCRRLDGIARRLDRLGDRLDRLEARHLGELSQRVRVSGLDRPRLLEQRNRPGMITAHVDQSAPCARAEVALRENDVGERRFYRPEGAGQKLRDARFDLGLIRDPEAWLTRRLGPLATFSLELPARPAISDADRLVDLTRRLRAAMARDLAARKAALEALAARLEAAAPARAAQSDLFPLPTMEANP